MSFSTLVIGAFDCNDRVHTFLVSSEYPGQPFSWDTFPGDDLPRQGPRKVGGYWAVPFSIRIQGNTPDDLEARIGALRAEIPGCDAAPETNMATIGQPNRSHVGTLTIHASPRIAVPVDVLYTAGESAQVSFTLTCDPYVNAAAEMLHDDLGFDAPCLVPLAGQTGQFATPLDLLLDAGALELTSCYVGHTDDETAVIGDFVKPLAAASWSAGSAQTDAAGYPAGAGNTVWRHTAAAYTDVDVTTTPAGQYLVFANCKCTDVGAGSTIETPFSGPVLIPTTTLHLLPLGVISLPIRVVRGAGTDLLRIAITGGGAAEDAAANYVALLPVSRGLIGRQVTSGHAHSVLWADGTMYVEDVVKPGEAYGGTAPLRTLKGQLVVLAEQATPAPTTHLHATAIDTPRWEQFPSAVGPRTFGTMALNGLAEEVAPTTDAGWQDYAAGALTADTYGATVLIAAVADTGWRDYS